MTQSLAHFAPLTDVQSYIYNRSNLRRSFEGFDDTEIAGIFVQGDHIIVVRNDGNEEVYSKEKVQQSFINFNHRLVDFFSYLGPNYRPPSLWHNHSYIMFQGWHYQSQLGKNSSNAHYQRAWADKFIRLTDIEKLKSLLQSDQTSIGYLIAPYGFRATDVEVFHDDVLVEAAETTINVGTAQAYCSCGAFQRQLTNLDSFSQEIKGFTPWCKHLTWFHKCREFQVKRADVITKARGNQPNKCCAWWYAPPSNPSDKGTFQIFHTSYGAQAPASHWRHYKPESSFTQDDAWDLFFNMLDAGYVPYSGVSLPQFSKKS